MEYLRHSCPIRVRDCVVRTLGLLAFGNIRPLHQGVQTRGANWLEIHIVLRLCE